MRKPRALFLTFNNIDNSNTGGAICSVRNLEMVSVFYKTDVFAVKNSKLSKMFSVFFLFFPPLSVFDYFKIKKKIKDNNYDLIFCDSSLFGILVKYLCAKGIDIKIITFFHNVEYDYVSVRFGGKIISYPYKVLSYVNEKLSLKHSRVTICLNKRDQDRIFSLYKKVVSLQIPITLNSKYDKNEMMTACENKSVEESYILFVGSLNRSNYISIEWFVNNVMPYLKQGRLLIVGVGFETMKDKLERSNVEIIGGVDNIEDYYFTSEVVVSPIIEGAGMKVKVAEALMYGKPIFGSSEAFEGFDISNEKCTIVCNSASEYIESLNLFLEQNNGKRFNSVCRDLFENNYSSEIAIKSFYTQVVGFIS